MRYVLAVCLSIFMLTNLYGQSIVWQKAAWHKNASASSAQLPEYCPDGQGNVYVTYYGSSGSGYVPDSLFKFDSLGGLIWAVPIPGGSYVMFNAGSGVYVLTSSWVDTGGANVPQYVYYFDAGTGAQLWTYAVPYVPSGALPAAAGRRNNALLGNSIAAMRRGHILHGSGIGGLERRRSINGLSSGGEYLDVGMDSAGNLYCAYISDTTASAPGGYIFEYSVVKLNKLGQVVYRTVLPGTRYPHIYVERLPVFGVDRQGNCWGINNTNTSSQVNLGDTTVEVDSITYTVQVLNPSGQLVLDTAIFCKADTDYEAATQFEDPAFGEGGYDFYRGNFVVPSIDELVTTTRRPGGPGYDTDTSRWHTYVVSITGQISHLFYKGPALESDSGYIGDYGSNYIEDVYANDDGIYVYGQPATGSNDHEFVGFSAVVGYTSGGSEPDWVVTDSASRLRGFIPQLPVPHTITLLRETNTVSILGSNGIARTSLIFPEELFFQDNSDNPEDFVADNHFVYAASTNLSTLYKFDLSGVLAVHPAGKSVAPKQFALDQNYPNPFNPVTTIRYELPKASFVHLSIYNILGQEVRTLVNGTQQAGYRSVSFDGSTLASGMYFYRITALQKDGGSTGSGKDGQAGAFSDVKKLLLVK